MMNMMTGAVAINGGVGVMEVRQSIAKNVAQAEDKDRYRGGKETPDL